MPLLDRISAARQRLRDGSLANEASVSIGVVLPILDALGWPAFDPGIVAPEYSVGTRRVDFALLTRGTPAVFVEVKQPGLAGHADRQLFEYAFHEGVPIAILTDGATWHVYLPAMQGTYDDRRVYLLDLLERDPADSAAMLRALPLARRRRERRGVRAGAGGLQAVAPAQGRRGARSRRRGRTSSSEPRLADLLAAEVESVCGFQPDPGDVVSIPRTSLQTSGRSAPRHQRQPPGCRAARASGSPATP